MSETKECPFCKSKAVVICRVDSDWGVELKYKLLNDASNYDIDSMIEFENYDIDFPSGDYGDIYVYRCQSCRAEWGDGVDVDIADLKARIAELEAERRWIPVSEKLPELNQDVLGLVDDVIVAGSFYQDLEHGIYFSDGGSGMLVATHWMPLPEPPEVER